MRVLIADDSATIRQILKKNLRGWGYDVVEVEDEFAGISGRMLVTGVKYLLDQDKGRTSVLSLTEPGAFRILAEESDGFDF